MKTWIRNKKADNLGRNIVELLAFRQYCRQGLDFQTATSKLCRDIHDICRGYTLTVEQAIERLCVQNGIHISQKQAALCANDVRPGVEEFNLEYLR